ncbi:GNAT family N-acetyltransferase [Rheinheimera mesophila]|uniref:GNAT family N-acetyltransferase n=1 Tax=Rheinheimera mesophila TaxID=1547515 RepID=A0A3P3QDG8_9GAMM|nr:GNAT family N-acetyltransferase [Rheinheimera mesophila]KKL00488.1 hypothetical protein SD53_14405 [Rheinheimera mesophila]RRJ18479.1 GNAT family N-acetyltransferase [Rheinheimera mesophila]
MANLTSFFNKAATGCLTQQQTDANSLTLLDPSAAPKLQMLLEQCTDYYVMADGCPPAPSAAADEFGYVPAGLSPDSKFIYAAENQQGNYHAMIEGLRHYPSSGVWYIGLMLVHPTLRSTGVGSRLFARFEALALTQGARELRLCVFDQNPESLKFWTRLGFEFRRKVAVQSFGVKLHSRTELSKSLVGQ